MPCIIPYARLHHKITLEDFEKSAMIATPINLLDASPIGDGAAAVYLVPAETLKEGKRILVAGSASATDTIAIHDRLEPLFLTAGYQSAQEAYEQAGVVPADIDVFELHDAFTIMSALSLEACGFRRTRQGRTAGLDGQIGPTGRIPVGNTRRAEGARVTRWVRRASTRWLKWFSSCGASAARPRCRRRASAWRRTSAAAAPPS